MRTIQVELTDVCIVTGLAGALDLSLKPEILSPLDDVKHFSGSQTGVMQSL